MYRTTMIQFNIAVVLLCTLPANSLWAQQTDAATLGRRLNQDSFTICREIRTNFRGIRGQRLLFDKAYEIHELADNIHRMMILQAPVQGMQQALSDLERLVDDLEHSLAMMQLPVLREPVIRPTGPNGYIFEGGNGYPQPRFQYHGYPYRMIPEREMNHLSQTLEGMQTAISQLQSQFNPQPVRPPVREVFPTPVPDQEFKQNRSQPKAGPIGPSIPDQKNRWQPARKSLPQFPSAQPPKPKSPASGGPEFLPPLPSADGD
ncbi:hypothetical protein [Gimesia maris]|uniref:hypothetical protein n=1 Tax=Gimesia maris TaxID=122 RepID=UPI00241CC51D|nr:hypothetical protein [Gimesia maris]|tara:strand:+ start:69891 stop:70673 length:783 start_codon:yes stop_codon:yes gene_type:complete